MNLFIFCFYFKRLQMSHLLYDLFPNVTFEFVCNVLKSILHSLMRKRPRPSKNINHTYLSVCNNPTTVSSNWILIKIHTITQIYVSCHLYVSHGHWMESMHWLGSLQVAYCPCFYSKIPKSQAQLELTGCVSDCAFVSALCSLLLPLFLLSN